MIFIASKSLLSKSEYPSLPTAVTRMQGCRWFLPPRMPEVQGEGSLRPSMPIVSVAIYHRNKSMNMKKECCSYQEASSQEGTALVKEASQTTTPPSPLPKFNPTLLSHPRRSSRQLEPSVWSYPYYRFAASCRAQQFQVEGNMAG